MPNKVFVFISNCERQIFTIIGIKISDMGFEIMEAILHVDETSIYFWVCLMWMGGHYYIRGHKATCPF